MTLAVKLPEAWDRQKLSRRERTALRDSAAFILQPELGRGPAVCACGHSGKGTKLVSVFLRADGTAGAGGILRCGSPWLCAECAPLKSNQRLERLTGLADALDREGGKLASVTITVGHDRGSRLIDIKQAIEAASRKARQGAPWHRQKLKHDVIGVLSAPEVTFSFTHGWHFHIHHAFLTGSGGSPEELGHWFVQRYLNYLAKAGFVATVQSQEVSLVRDPKRFFGYLKKGVGQTTQDVWNLRRTESLTGKHLYPFDILQKASGCRLMKSLWREYADVMPGTRSCVITRSIADRLNIRQDDDGREVQHHTVAGRLPASLWKTLLNKRKTNTVLSLVEDRGVGAWQYIYSLALTLAEDHSSTSCASPQDKIPMRPFEHRPSAAQVAKIALHLKCHLSLKERNGEAVRRALDQERGYAVAHGLAFYPPRIREILEIYGGVR